MTVWIIAQSAIVRAGLTALVERDEELQAADSEAKFASLSADVAEPPFEIVLAHLENAADIVFLKQFLSESEEGEAPAPVVALLSPGLSGEQTATEVLQAGADGVLPDSAAENQIRAAIKAVAAGLTVVDKDLRQTLTAFDTADNFAESNDAASAEFAESLTPREREVLELLAEGASNKIIASRLGISEHTVKFHVASIFGKLNAATRTEAVTEGLRRGLILL